MPATSADNKTDSWIVYEITAFTFLEKNSSQNSPIVASVSVGANRTLLGTFANLGKSVTYNITLNNTDLQTYSDVLVAFRIPSCVAINFLQSL